MIVRSKYEKLNAALVLDGYRVGYVENPQRYAQVLLEGRKALKVSPISKDFIYSMTPSWIIAWVFSRHEEPSRSPFYQFFLQAKYRLHRYIRRVTSFLGTIHDAGIHLKERMVFKDFSEMGKPTHGNEMKVKAIGELGVRVGDEGDETEGTLITCKLVRIEWPEGFCKKQNIPRDTGFYAAIDLLLKSDAEESEVEAAALSIKVMIMKHLDPALKENPFYKSVNVFPHTNDVDGASVIRIQFLYNRNVSPDGFLERMGVPYTIPELIDLQGEAKMNVHILDVTQSSSTVNLDLLFAGRLDLQISYKRDMIIKILKRAAIALAGGISESTIQVKAEDKYVDKWLHIRPLFPTMIAAIKSIIKTISGSRNVSCMFKFPVLSDMLKKLGHFMPWMRVWLPPEVGSVPGYVPAKLEENIRKFMAEVNKVFASVREHLEEKILREKDKRTLKFINMKTREDGDDDFEGAGQASAMETKLKHLGLNDMSAEDLLQEALEDDENKGPADFLEAEEGMQFNYDGRALEMYEHVQKVVLGVHSLDFFLGKSRFYIIGQGLDFMEVVPTPPSYTELDKEIQRKDAELKKSKN